MAISYLLAPNPKWYIADLVGRPLGGGTMFTFRSLDKTQQKFVFQDPAGNFPWTDPILFDENGAQGPFYWEVDSSNLQETYYIEVYDADGVLQWTIDNFAPPGSGGGSIITTAIDLENLVVNNVFWRNLSNNTNPATPISVANTFTVIAPGCHAGFALTQNASPAQNAGPDIVLLKNNTSATESISFPFFPLGSTPLTGDVTPLQYLNYTCSLAGTSETQKCIQIPITSKVQNLTNQDVTITIWARGNSGTTTLNLKWRTFYGDGAGASPDDMTPIQTLNLTGSFQKFVVQDTVPNVSGKTLGGCGNDALFLQIEYPFDAVFNIDMTKPSMYLGTISPDQDFHSYDQIDGVLNVPRTGAIRTTMSSTADLGWVMMNDGTIGNASSNATTRANIDTFPLFNLIWNNVSNTNAPLFNSAGTPIARGASSVADFTANNQISLPKSLGRALSNTGLASSGATTTWVIGQAFGEQDHQLTIAELAAHDHAAISGSFLVDAPNTGIYGGGGLGSVKPTTDNTGGDVAHNTMQPTQFQNFMIKL